MNRKLFLLSFLFFIACANAWGQFCEYSNSVWEAKEKLTYQVYYNVSFVWVPAGEFTFEVFESETEYLIEAVGKTYESYNSFFEVDDYFASRINKETGRPISFIRDMSEGGYTKYDSIQFNHDIKRATGRLGKTKATAEAYDLPIGECVHDIISIIYAFRNLNFEEMQKNEKVAFSLFFDKSEYPLQMKYEGIQKKKIRKLGKRECHLIAPQLVASSVFDENSEMKIWVTNDSHHFALMAESPISVGSVKAILKSVEGIDYDLKKK